MRVLIRSLLTRLLSLGAVGTVVLACAAGSAFAAGAMAPSSGAANKSADVVLDYRCLQTCMAQGQTAKSCMEQSKYGCAYAAPVKPAVPASDSLLSPNRQFSPPTPVASDTIVSQPVVIKNQSLKATLDYKCRASCLQAGYQYGYCQQRCAP